MLESTLRCGSCGHHEEQSARFCQQCGAPLLEGKLAGAVRLDQRIGDGGMGVVYRGTHTRMDTVFAVKVLHKELIHNEQVSQRFYSEARISSKLRHQHIVFLSDFGEIAGFGPYITMEFLEGRTLDVVLEAEGMLAPRRCLAMLAQVCDAMHHAHQQGVVHRDLKPSNLFLLDRAAHESDFIKVLDFGIGKVLWGESMDLTQTGATLGTPLYMAPEQFVRGNIVDHRLDIYALGTITYEMLTGTLPFMSDQVLTLAMMRLQQVAPPVSEIFPFLYGSKIEAFLQHALAREPLMRIESMLAFRRGLEDAIVELEEMGLAARPLAVGAATITGVGPDADIIRPVSVRDAEPRQASEKQVLNELPPRALDSSPPLSELSQSPERQMRQAEEVERTSYSSGPYPSWESNPRLTSAAPLQRSAVSADDLLPAEDQGLDAPAFSGKPAINKTDSGASTREAWVLSPSRADLPASLLSPAAEARAKVLDELTQPVDLWNGLGHANIPKAVPQPKHAPRLPTGEELTVHDALPIPQIEQQAVPGAAFLDLDLQGKQEPKAVPSAAPTEGQSQRSGHSLLRSQVAISEMGSLTPAPGLPHFVEEKPTEQAHTLHRAPRPEEASGSSMLRWILIGVIFLLAGVVASLMLRQAKKRKTTPTPRKMLAGAMAQPDAATRRAEPTPSLAMSTPDAGTEVPEPPMRRVPTKRMAVTKARQVSKQRLRQRQRRARGRPRVRRRRIVTKIAAQLPRTRTLTKKRVAPPVRRKTLASDGCPVNQGQMRWVRLISQDRTVVVKFRKKRIARSARAKGWCVPVGTVGGQVEVTDPNAQLAYCFFTLRGNTTRRTIRLSMQLSDDVDAGSYCRK